MDIDVKELSIAEFGRIVDQLVRADETRVVKNVSVKDFEIVDKS